MTACYIDSAFPAALHFAYKYSDSVEAALLANANAGGENVARGAVVGALLGAAHGMAGFPDRLTALKHREDILREIDGVLAVGSGGGSSDGAAVVAASALGAGEL